MPAEEARMKRDVRILFFCQALMNASVVGQVAMGGLVGYSLATDKSLATLPLALQMVATMAASIPAGIIFSRLGRRAGFLMGAAGSFCGALTFALGIWLGDFWVYALGALPAGIGFGIAQHYRFAAAEVASPAYRPKAISLVMAGGVLAAIFGPELVKHSRNLFEPFIFLGTYLILALLPIACAVLLTKVRLPPHRGAGADAAGHHLQRSRGHQQVHGAIAHGAGAGGGQEGRAAQDLDDRRGHLGPRRVIQAHAVAMFTPGFFTGRLIARWGARTIIAAGVGLNALCVAVATQDETFWHFTVALVLLGLGWNFMFTGATTLLGEAHSPDERVRAQTANDFIVFGTVACTALGSGVIHATAGWEVLSLLLLPALLFALVLTLFLRPARARAA